MNLLLTLCNTLQHPATHCTAPQHAATHCNTLRHTVEEICIVSCSPQHNTVQRIWAGLIWMFHYNVIWHIWVWLIWMCHYITIGPPPAPHTCQHTKTCTNRVYEYDFLVSPHTCQHTHTSMIRVYESNWLVLASNSAYPLAPHPPSTLTFPFAFCSCLRLCTGSLPLLRKET